MSIKTVSCVEQPFLLSMNCIIRTASTTVLRIKNREKTTLIGDDRHTA